MERLLLTSLRVLRLGSRNPRPCLAKTGLCVAPRMRQRHEHLLLPQRCLAHVILSPPYIRRRKHTWLSVAPDPFGSMALLLWLRFIIEQTLIDDSQPWSRVRPL